MRILSTLLFSGALFFYTSLNAAAINMVTAPGWDGYEGYYDPFTGEQAYNHISYLITYDHMKEAIEDVCKLGEDKAWYISELLNEVDAKCSPHPVTVTLIKGVHQHEYDPGGDEHFYHMTAAIDRTVFHIYVKVDRTKDKPLTLCLYEPTY